MKFITLTVNSNKRNTPQPKSKVLKHCLTVHRIHSAAGISTFLNEYMI